MDTKKIEAILGYYSPEGQTIKAIEELAELQTELARILNGRGDMSGLITELADVQIMISQIIKIYEVDPELLEREIRFKLERQIRRIAEERRSSIQDKYTQITIEEIAED